MFSHHFVQDSLLIRPYMYPLTFGIARKSSFVSVCDYDIVQTLRTDFNQIQHTGFGAKSWLSTLTGKIPEIITKLRSFLILKRTIRLEQLIFLGNQTPKEML